MNNKQPNVERSVEEIVEELDISSYLLTQETFEDSGVTLRELFTQTLQAERQRREEVVENLNISTKIDFIKPEDQSGYRKAQTDIITQLQAEVNKE